MSHKGVRLGCDRFPIASKSSANDLSNNVVISVAKYSIATSSTALAVAIGLALGSSPAWSSCVIDDVSSQTCINSDTSAVNSPFNTPLNDYNKVITGTLNVTEEGQNGEMVSASTDYNLIEVINKGAINVSSNNSAAIRISSSAAGDVVVRHEKGATITSTGTSTSPDGTFRSDTILITKGNKSTGNVNVVVDGDITTTGANRASGVHVMHYGVGDINVTGSGNITASASGGGTNIYSYGIAAVKNSGSKGNAVIDYNSGTIKDSSVYGFALYSAHVGLDGDVSVTNRNGTLITSGKDSYGIWSRNLASVSGNAYAHNLGGNIYTTGASSHGILAESNIGDVEVNNTGLINVEGAGSIGINTKSGTGAGATVIKNTGTINALGANGAGGIKALSDSGSIRIENSGAITVGNDPLATGDESSIGIRANITNAKSNADITIINSGHIITNGTGHAFGLYGRTEGSGTVTIQSNGANITTNNTGVANHGIEAISKSGTASIEFSNGRVEVNGSSWGLAAWDDSANATGKANVVVKSGVIDGSKTLNGAIHSASQAEGVVYIDANSQVIGGWTDGTRTGNAISLGGQKGELINHGSVEALSDLAVVVASTTAGATAVHTMDNYGTLTGYVRLGDESTTLSNWSSNSWNIRNFADTDGDGVRDTKAVAISNFGGGDDTVKNEATGTIRLSAVTGETKPVVTTGEYVPVGALSITNAGTVQGQLVNLNRFENRGTIDLTANQQAGDVFVITGGSTAGSNGNGTFVADGGSIMLDSVLNEGGTNSLSDMLVLDNVTAGTSKTRIIIHRVDGMGSVTEGDGIKVLEVLGDADSGSFELGNIVKSGLYEYTLHEGSLSAPGDKNYYLRATAQQINPDVGSYLANQVAATGLFMHSLHDRLGEPQYYQNYQNEGRVMPAMWLRGKAGYQNNQAGGGTFNQHTQNTLLHLGGEIANWTGNGDNRYHLGLMGAYGRSESRTTSRVTGSKVNSSVNGYGVGAYLTWYSNPASVEGWYTDVWSMYNWFDNKTEGSEKYRSKSWTTSLEVGYARKLVGLERYNWLIEPQAQLAYNYYDMDRIKDRNGLMITDADASGIASRLGIRTYLRPSDHQNGFQPFLELNWLYNNANNSMVFNGETISDDTPKNRFETKVGVQGEVTRNLSVYSHIGLQWGKNSYESAEGQVGVRYWF